MNSNAFIVLVKKGDSFCMFSGFDFYIYIKKNLTVLALSIYSKWKVLNFLSGKHPSMEKPLAVILKHYWRSKHQGVC